MNRVLAIIGILILIGLGLIQVQLYRQTAVLEATEARLNDLAGQVGDIQSQLDDSPANNASDQDQQCTPDVPRKQI